MIGMRVGDDRPVDRLPGIDVKIAGPTVNAGCGYFEKFIV
jgi:hypothetical protein